MARRIAQAYGTRIKRVSTGKGKVGIVDHSDFVMRKLQGALGDAAEAVATMAVEAVQAQMLWGYKDVHGLPDNPHTEIVDTGRLFDSIKATVNRKSQNTYTVSVGTDVPYGIFVHEGTRKLKGRPFIVDAMSSSYSAIESAIAKTLRQKMKK